MPGEAMDCEDVRQRLLDYQRGDVEPSLHAAVRAHLEGCAACARVETAEHVLTDVLERRLPQHAASAALKRRLAGAWSNPVPRTPRRWLAFAPALAVVALALVGGGVLARRALVGTETPAMVTEAVNDHLRALLEERPQVESGNSHTVKPWFAGKLDFAPVVPFGGDEDFPLRGGSLGYFLDRRAAVFHYGRRLHAISLLVFRADGLPWPSGGVQRVGALDVHAATAQGFHVLLWRQGELGYALISDVDPADLRILASRLSPPG
jgi:anti-sigma factor RsiW